MLKGWRVSLLIGAIGAAVMTASPARGDVFLLITGGQVEGDLLNRDESPRVNYVVRLASGGEITLPKKQVSNVVVQSESQRRYEELLPKMPLTVEGHWKMAEWCRENSLDAYRETHLREVVKLDPNHEGARLGLGYTKLNGEWTTPDDYFRSLGYVKHGTAWRLPQELERLTAQEKWRREELDWKNKLRVLRGKIGRKGGERALEEIRGIRDPAATAALIQMLDAKDELRDMKFLYLEVLARLGTSGAVNTLAQRAIYDDDAGLRDKALDLLEPLRTPQLVTSIAQRLKDDKNLTINRAAVVLGRLGDASVTPALIDALMTRHKQTINTGGGSGSVSPAFSSNGGAGLSMGGGPKVIQQDVQNESVLGALTAIHSGVNFGYDELAWKRWWAETQTPRVVDLRRDE